ncbi:helix-turn-helix transcriptional regulator [Actinacidiphila sp. DG2A-62]|uniref:helix-turn-helix transcriptional regulator n=1 Tax=Actinacidiphila sp. DG2A-62 TaxID=3108821 RepID=UPI002DBA5EB9|nr:helix-turn-helix transcriptional regulator [Actinacidiphila sp. DG2A-62]MEC3996220.1 helix-turn-helix transcriptional regulator [Actinacidiphila sp. DG2A-62]
MTYAGQAGHDRITDLALGALHASDPDELWRTLAEEVLRALDADLVVHKEEEWTPQRGRVRMWEPTEQLGGEAMSEQLRARVRRCYPFIDHYIVSTDPAPTSAVGIIGRLAWRNTAYATISYEELGVRDMLTIPFPDTSLDEPYRGWKLLRSSDYTPAQVEYAKRLQPLLCGVERQCRNLRALRRPVSAGSDAVAGPDAAAGPSTGLDPVRLAAEHGLTPRETVVLGLLGNSLTAEAIGRRLGISVRTAQKHIGNLYRKLSTADRLSTVLRAQALGLLPPPRHPG